MSVRVSDLIKEMMPYVPGCPGPVARREMVKSAQRFCRATRIIVSDVNPFTVRAGDEAIDLNDYADTQTDAIGVSELYIGGIQIVATTLQVLRSRVVDYRNTAPAQPRIFYQTTERNLAIWPKPDAAYDARVVVVCAPQNRATVFQDALGYQWREAVIGGAIAATASIPGQPYTSVDQAGRGAALFQKGVAEARIELNRSFGSDARVQMRPFA